jgi:hypothetical protein
MTRRRRHDDEDDERRRVLRDGERMRVPMFAMDGWQRDMAEHFQRMRHHDTADEITTHARPMVVDAFGDSGAGLHRPGARYLHAGHRSVDHAVQATLRVLRDEAYEQHEAEEARRWQDSDREITVKAISGDARVDALLAYEDHVSNAWRGEHR